MRTHYNLNPIHTNQKSFYNKAVVITSPNTISLKSYQTIVCSIDLTTNTLQLNGYYSTTTARHIREFCVQHGFENPSKKQLDNRDTLTK